MHRPYNFYFEIPYAIQDYILSYTRLEDITMIPLEEINDIFTNLPESEYIKLLALERKSHKHLH